MIRKVLVYLSKLLLKLAGESDFDIWQAFKIFQ